MIMVHSHISFAAEWSFISDRLCGAERIVSVPQHLIEFVRESRESCGTNSTGFFCMGLQNMLVSSPPFHGGEPGAAPGSPTKHFWGVMFQGGELALQAD